MTNVREMPLRVLLVNKFYYPRGGDCVVVMNTERLLRDMGHEVAVFAMQYPESSPSPWSQYFAPEVNFNNGIGGKINMLKRTMGMGDITKSFTRVLNEFKPDVVHLNNIHSYLSPQIAKIAHQRGIRVVWTLHDYKLLCPAYSCVRGGLSCEICFNNKKGVMKYRCMKGSLAGSALAYLEAKMWNRKKLESYTDAFICPSQFMAKKMAQGGFAKDKLRVLCNFVDPEKLEVLKQTPLRERKPYYCYVGRLSQEKGVHTLLKAAVALPYELRIAGDGPLADELRQQYGRYEQIKFLGHQDAKSVANLLSDASFLVQPSECYENNPLGVIEALCAGTPVVGSMAGGIPELIDPTTGITFAAGHAQALVEAIDKAMQQQWNNASIKEASIKRFSPETHYQALLTIYNA